MTEQTRKVRLVRITTAPLSLKYLLRGQMRFMRENGIEVLMVSSDGPEREDVIQYEGCDHRVVPMTRKMTPFADLRALWDLYRLFRKEKPDIVHSHTPKAGLLAMLAARMAGVKCRIHTIAGLRFMTVEGNTRKLLVAMEKLTMRAATHVWPNSFSLRDYIVSHELAPASSLEVIGMGSSNGINLRRFNPAALKTDELEKVKLLIGYDRNLVYMLTVGRIVRDKGIDELVKAFDAVYKKHPQVRLVLVGALEEDLDPVTPESKTMIETHPAIISAGWNEGVEYFMHLADMLVHPSHREGFPNVLLQAGAMSCPVLCSRIEGNIDIVDDGVTGLIFEKGNAAELEETMLRAIAAPDIIRQHAASLLVKITEHFNQPVVHAYLLEKYKQLSGSGKEKP